MVLFIGKIKIENGATEKIISNVNKKTVLYFLNKTNETIEDMEK